MAGFRDNQMVVDHDVQRVEGPDDFVGEGHVGIRRAGVAAGVVVDENNGCGTQCKGAAHDFPRENGGLVDGALLVDLVGDEHVLAVHVENAELFGFFARHLGGAVVDEAGPGGEHRLLHHAGLHHALGGGLYGFKGNGGGFGEAFDGGELGHRGGEDVFDAVEFFEQGFRQRLHIAARDGHEEKEFEEFVIGQRVWCSCEARLEARPVTFMVGLFLSYHRAGNAGLWGRA